MQLDSTKFVFSNASIKEILFYVNLDDEEIISKENVFFYDNLFKAAKITESFFDKEDGEQNEQI